MRIYESCAEMYAEEKRNLHEMGTLVHPQTMQDRHVAGDPGFQTLELAPAVFTIMNGEDRDSWLAALGKNLRWALTDFEERIASFWPGQSAVNPGAAWKYRQEEWEPFIHEGKFAYTYSERFGLHAPGVELPILAHVVKELSDRPDTRQAVLPIFNSGLDLQNVGGTARIPCSLHYQFMRRGGKLKMMYVMRSCDFFTHFPYDIWHALQMRDFVAGQLGIEPGHFTFFTGSLHIYRKDAEEGVF